MDIAHLRNPRIITCIVPAGMGRDLVDALYHEKNINTANFVRARGASQRSGTFADEMDKLTVVVEMDRSDEIFEFLYFKAEIGTAPHRFMYQAPLDLATLFSLPEIEELD
ncbi:MAG: hypothetical protein R3200_09390 [Xanthomonadales bacterium]|nr:hypothetical protein [Xanthomonadales bacterium]